jgi:hypothetical protein
MVPTPMKNYWSAVTVIVVACLLQATKVDATPATFNLQASIAGADAVLSGTFARGQTISRSYAFQSTTAAVLPLDTTDGVSIGAISALLLSSTWGYSGSQAGGCFNSLEVSHLGLTDGYGATRTNPGNTVNECQPDSFDSFLQANSAAVLNSDALPSAPPDPSESTSTAINLAKQKLSFVFALVRTTLTSVTKSVAKPESFILFGSGLLGLVFLIRRITAIKRTENRSHSEDRAFGMNTEPQSNCPAAEFTNPAAPFFNQNASVPADSVALSQPS